MLGFIHVLVSSRTNLCRLFVFPPFSTVNHSRIPLVKMCETDQTSHVQEKTSLEAKDQWSSTGREDPPGPGGGWLHPVTCQEIHFWPMRTNIYICLRVSRERNILRKRRQCNSLVLSLWSLIGYKIKKKSNKWLCSRQSVSGSTDSSLDELVLGRHYHDD